MVVYHKDEIKQHDSSLDTTYCNYFMVYLRIIYIFSSLQRHAICHKSRQHNLFFKIVFIFCPQISVVPYIYLRYHVYSKGIIDHIYTCVNNTRPKDSKGNDKKR